VIRNTARRIGVTEGEEFVVRDLDINGGPAASLMGFMSWNIEEGATTVMTTEVALVDMSAMGIGEAGEATRINV